MMSNIPLFAICGAAGAKQPSLVRTRDQILRQARRRMLRRFALCIEVGGNPPDRSNAKQMKNTVLDVHIA